MKESQDEFNQLVGKTIKDIKVEYLDRIIIETTTGEVIILESDTDGQGSSAMYIEK